MDIKLSTDLFDFGVVTLANSTYGDGSPALVADFVYDGEGERETLSTNLSYYGMTPEPGNVFIKDYSEHEGLTDALVKAGAVTMVRPITFGPFNSGGFEVKLAPSLNR